ncbi:MAG: DUF2577 family protein [Candidatus Gastranaerophilales bacterium]|nr:DUF2577 family protein [Candidatus Gastranaerophilales bacterium]
MNKDKNKSGETFIEILKGELDKRKNPGDLKPSIIGKVVQIDPTIVQIEDGKILLTENDELEISEWFRFRCGIDSEGALSSSVPENLENAKSTSEVHSQGGAECQMKSAISFLAEAISSINTELLALRCNLRQGDYVVIAALDEMNKYILLDKVLSDESAKNKETEE